jgi:hypothetical protein
MNEDHAHWPGMWVGSCTYTEADMSRSLRRGVAARVGTVVVAIAAIAAMILPGASATVESTSPSASGSATASHTTCISKGLSTTCTGTYSGNTAWNPWTGEDISQQPVVTVSQTKDLTDQVVDVDWKYFTPTLNEQNWQASGNASNVVGGNDFYNTDIFECKGTNPDPRLPDGDLADGGGLGQNCYDYPLDGPPAPSGLPNALSDSDAGVTYAPEARYAPETWEPSGQANPNATGGNPETWTGSAQFHIEAGVAENSQLGCNSTTPCSLVIDPNFGGNYDLNPSTAVENTNTSGCDYPGNPDPSASHYYDNVINNDFDASGANSYNGWACQIEDMIVVPLSFAPTVANCPPKAPEFYAQGSPMMSRAMTQWESGWCTGSAPVTTQFTAGDESDARNAFLAGGQALAARVDMALVTLPPDAGQTTSRKFTYAPLANSAVAMAYEIDDPQTEQRINRVVLNADLVAKLTTESYSLDYDCTVQPQSPWPALPAASSTCDPAVARNPHTPFDDQEFLSLNKDCEPTEEPTNYTCSSSDFPSDATGNTQLGEFMPTVLGGYSDMTYQMTDWVAANKDASAFLAGRADPYGMHINTNYWGVVSYPSQFFSTLDPGTKYPGALTCPKGVCATPWDASMNVAWNFVTGLDHITDDLLLLQPTADSPYLACLLPGNQGCTQIGQMGFSSLIPESPTNEDLFSEIDLGDAAAYQFPTTAMVNGAGVAVTPTQASVEAAVRDMETNPDGITQYVNQSSTDKAAYPLSMVDYAMVPTCGLSSSEAGAIADFLDKAATTGQVQGNAPGELAPGYYPLTNAQRAQTLKAAQEVKSQDCVSAPRDNTVDGHTHVDDVTTPSKSNNPSGPGATPGSTKSPKRSPSASASPSSVPGRIQTAAFGQKSPYSGMAGILLLLAIIAGALLLIGGPTVWVVTATGKWPVVIRWMQPVLRPLRAVRTWLGRATPSGKA